MEQIVIAHLSDLHFGDSLFMDRVATGFSQTDHDSALFRALPGTLNDIRLQADLAPTDTLHVIVSGDLTDRGSAAQFRIAREFLQSRRAVPGRPGLNYGLALANDQLMTVPGNHDHWDGRSWWKSPPYNAAIMGTWFATTPWKRVLTSPNGQLQVEVYGVDSNSGMVVKKTNRRANGLIHSLELLELEKLLQASTPPPPGVRQVRLLVCHHSFQGHFPMSWFFGALELADSSRSALAELAGKYHIAAILTGHTHDFLADRYVTRGGPPTHRLAELRSACTLAGPAREYRQGLWAHRILLDAQTGQAYWSAWPYQWDGFDFCSLDLNQGWDPYSGGWLPFPLT